jgi:tetratricopeptide (TPR) repeat protein
MSHQVFISYSTRDTPIADKIRDQLEAAGICCWMAPRDMKHFLPYGETILRALIGCRVVVVVFSSHAKDSPYVCREVERGVAHRKTLATIRVEDIRPQGELEFFLSNRHWVDAIGTDLESKLDELVVNVNRVLASPDTAAAPLAEVDGRIGALRILDEPHLAEQAWSAVISHDEYRATIENLTRRMVRNRQPEASLAGATDAEQLVLRKLEAEGVVSFQRSPVPRAGDYVLFANRMFCRLALADWLVSQLDAPSFDLLQAMQQFPLLADGLAQLIRGRWTSHGRQILEQCVSSQHDAVERLVAGVVGDLAKQAEILSETRALVIQKGSDVALRGLARGAQRLMVAEHFDLSLDTYRELGDMLRQRQQSGGGSQTKKFLVEIANEHGRILKRQGQLRQAADHFRCTLNDALEVDDDELIGTVTNNLASSLLAMNPSSEKINADVLDLLTDNVRRLEGCECHRQLAVTFHYLGRLYYSSYPKQAEHWFRRDVEVCRGMNDPLALADALNTLGVFCANRNLHHEADVVHKEEVGLFRGVLDPTRQARALAASGANCLAKGYREKDRASLERACDELHESVAVYRRLDQKAPREHAAALENLGRTYFLLGDTIRGTELMLDAAEMNECWTGGQQIAQRIRDELESLK